MTKFGYTRVSTIEQSHNFSLENQRESLIKSGVDKDNIFEEVASAKDLEREQLKKLLTIVKTGDEIVVHKLDRLARNTLQCLKLIDDLEKRGVSVSLPDMLLSGNAPAALINRGLYSIMAELELNQRAERQKEGIARAKLLKRYKGRKTKIDNKTRVKVLEYQKKGISKKEMAKLLSMSRTTIYKVIGQLKK